MKLAFLLAIASLTGAYAGAANLSDVFACNNLTPTDYSAGVSEFTGANVEPKAYFVASVTKNGAPGFYVFSSQQLYFCALPKAPSVVVDRNTEHSGSKTYNVHVDLPNLKGQDLSFSKSDGETEFESSWTFGQNQNLKSLGTKDCVSTPEDLNIVSDRVVKKIEHSLKHRLTTKEDVASTCASLSGIGNAVARALKPQGASQGDIYNLAHPAGNVR